MLLLELLCEVNIMTGWYKKQPTTEQERCLCQPFYFYY